MSCTFFKGDCLEQLKKISDNSIQLILWDPPYGTTKQPWDSKLPWEELFEQCFRILKSTGMLVIFSSIPFNYTLIRSAPKPPNYTWYWKKNIPTCPLIANQQPMRCIEEVLVWRKQKNTYYRQQIGDEERLVPNMRVNDYYGKNVDQNRELHTLKGKTRTHLLQFAQDVDGFSTRPEELVELLIKTYTKEGDVVLDPTCYKGLSGKVCKRLGRSWKGIDLNFIPPWLFNQNSL